MSLNLMYGVTLTVEIALSAATGTYGLWDGSVWDTGTWGPDVVWTDVSFYVRSANTNRRFSREVGQWESGVASIVLNNRDGRFSPGNLGGPYVTGSVTQIRPWRPVRIRAAYAGVTYDVYYGYIIKWDETYPGGGFDSQVTVSCVDELARLAAFAGLPNAATGFGGELTGDRVHRILNNAGHAGTRNVAAGQFTCQDTALTANAATDLKLTVDTEGGAFYIDAAGAVVFCDRVDLIENLRSNTAQAQFGDDVPTALASEIKYADVNFEYNGDQVVNIYAWQRANSTNIQQAADSTSRALYGDRRNARQDLLNEVDGQVLSLASLELAQNKDPELRAKSCRIIPRKDPVRMFPLALGLRVRDRAIVRRRPVGGYTLTRNVFISGIAHTITKDNWTTDYQFASATAWDQFTLSQWDVASWDSGTWFY